MKVVAALVVVFGAGGCLVGEVAGIPCTADGECATAHFCDLTIGSCRAEVDGVSAPRLQVAGVAVAGVVADDVVIAGAAATDLEVVLQNAGGLAAVDVALALAPPPCLTMEIDEGTVPDGVVPGGSARVGVTARPDGTCPVSLDVAWRLSYSGRTDDGAFSLTLE